MTSKNAKLRALNVYYCNVAYGGVEKLLITLARQHDLTGSLNLAFAFFPQDPLSEAFVALNCPVLPLCLEGVHLRNPLSVMSARKKFRTLLEQHEIDVVVVHNFEPWLWLIIAPAVRSARLPLILWVHNLSDGSGWLDRRAKMTLPDWAICNSRFTKGQLAAVLPSVTSDVLYCPSGLPSIYARTENNRRLVRAQHGVSEEDVVLVQAGRLDECKGHGLLVETLGKLRDLPGWVCWLLGDPQFPHEIGHLERLKSQAQDLAIADRVRFLGYQADVHRFLCASDIYCQPNTAPEGFGLSFVEALSAKLPVVTTAIGGALEIVDESCGILTPLNDADALASALATLIRNKELRVRLGANGPARARQLCDPEKQMRQLEAILFKVHSLRQSTKRQ